MATPDSLQRHREAVRARLLRSDHVRTGPDSITWKINREMIVVAGWGRAILLQLAHPAVAAGVHGHSGFRGSLRSSFRRLHSTVGAMLSLTFGDTEQMIRAAAGINAIHDRVRGTVSSPCGAVPTYVARADLHPSTGSGWPEPVEGQARGPGLEARAARQETYSAHDPDLQRWVHATLLDSIPLVYERLVGPLTKRERDQYCSEASIMEPLLGMPAGWLPRDGAHLDAYMGDMLAGGTLAVTDTSRALARALLYPPRWYLFWPAFRAMQLLTIGSLPPGIREAYGFEWRPRDERALARWTKLLRTSQRVLPPLVREWPVARHA